MVENRETFLVTGASGFIGNHLAELLVSALPDATVIAQHSPGRPPDLKPSSNVITLATRLTDMSRALADERLPQRFDGVFHLAAFTPKASGDEDEAAVVESNIVGLREVLAACERRTDRFIFASTLDVYGTPTARLSEESLLRPETVYAASKVLGEVVLRRWGKRAGARTGVLRVGHVYGPGEAAYRKLIPNTIRALLSGQAALQYGEGRERRDFLYVADAAVAFVEAWRAMRTGDLETLNLVSGAPVSVAEVIDLLRAIVGDGAAVERRASASPGASFEFDSRRLDDKLPFARTTLETGLRAEVEWFRGRMSVPCS
jgi:nucleoside-diphosphate-sugar epimerase